MVSYRTPLGYHKKFGRALTDESGPSYGECLCLAVFLGFHHINSLLDTPSRL
jgi:hypothetical protein